MTNHRNLFPLGAWTILLAATVGACSSSSSSPGSGPSESACQRAVSCCNQKGGGSQCSSLAQRTDAECTQVLQALGCESSSGGGDAGGRVTDDGGSTGNNNDASSGDGCHPIAPANGHCGGLCTTIGTDNNNLFCTLTCTSDNECSAVAPPKSSGAACDTADGKCRPTCATDSDCIAIGWAKCQTLLVGSQKVPWCR